MRQIITEQLELDNASVLSGCLCDVSAGSIIILVVVVLIVGKNFFA